MSTLKVNKLRDTAGSADAITLDPNGGAVLAGVTTVTSVKVGAAVTISESGIEASGIGITCASINGTQIGGRRNLIINGAMTVAQRGTSSTTVGYQTLDRYYLDFNGTDEAPTQAQVDVASGTTPYTNGFRKAYKITNGNQSGGAGTSDAIMLDYSIEAQDIANSGWNYTSSSSFVTLSFWVKSSVAQNFYGRLYSYDGTAQGYAFETGSLSADTWTKVVKTIPGNSNLTFDNNSGAGLLIELIAFRGTAMTGSMTLDQWAAYNSNARVPDMTSTWYTTNDATLEFTGIQLEVGPQATPFEHRTLQEEYLNCLRYYQKCGSSGQYNTFQGLRPIGHSASTVEVMTDFRGIPMRTTPTVAFTDGSLYIRGCASSYVDTAVSLSGSNYALSSDGITHTGHFWVAPTSGSPFVACQSGRVTGVTNGAYIEFKAEL